MNPSFLYFESRSFHSRLLLYRLLRLILCGCCPCCVYLSPKMLLLPIHDLLFSIGSRFNCIESHFLTSSYENLRALNYLLHQLLSYNTQDLWQS